MPYLTARLITLLPHDKSSDGGRITEKKGDRYDSRILDTYHQQNRKKARIQRTEEAEFVIYDLSWGQGQIRSILTIINPRPSFVTYEALPLGCNFSGLFLMLSMSSQHVHVTNSTTWQRIVCSHYIWSVRIVLEIITIVIIIY